MLLSKSHGPPERFLSKGQGERSRQRPPSRSLVSAQATRGIDFLPEILCAVSVTASLSPNSINIMLTFCLVDANPGLTSHNALKPQVSLQSFPRGLPSLRSRGFSEPAEKGAMGWRVLDGEKQGGNFRKCQPSPGLSQMPPSQTGPPPSSSRGCPFSLTLLFRSVYFLCSPHNLK